MERKKGKRNIISALINEYDIKTAADIQEALKDLLGSTIQDMLEAEMTDPLGYDPYERSENSNACNGKKLNLSLAIMAIFKLMFLRIERDLLNLRS